MAEMEGPTWVGEGKKINVVEPTIVPVTLKAKKLGMIITASVSYTHLRAHETGRNLVCRLLLEKKK
ncbi:hypothetical protein CDFC105_91546 [Clostridioides difficile]|nr:hypothetical protein CDFC105_91546 [Clostridioides difficile]